MSDTPNELVNFTTCEPGLIGFLKTPRSKDELATALAVILEFKQCESDNEWLFVPFAAWAKLEQLQEFLEHLVEGKPLEKDTLARMEDISNA